jgi:hypothetical protein
MDRDSACIWPRKRKACSDLTPTTARSQDRGHSMDTGIDKYPLWFAEKD